MDNAVFADFRVVAELGRGSFGTVYKAKWKCGDKRHKNEDGESERVVVLKRIDFKPWHQEKHRLAAKKEVTMLSKVRHGNIIQYFPFNRRLLLRDEWLGAENH